MPDADNRQVLEEDFSKLPGGASPRWVSGEKYDRAYATANHLSRRVAALTEVILAIDSAAIPLGATEDDFTAVGYYVPIAPLHKALGAVGHSGARNDDLIDPPLPPSWWMHLLRRAVERTGATQVVGQESQPSVVTPDAEMSAEERAAWTALDDGVPE